MRIVLPCWKGQPSFLSVSWLVMSSTRSILGPLLRDFTARSSAHGLSRVSGAISRYEKAFWALVLVASTGALLWQTALLAEKYLSRPLIVQTRLRIGEKPFPAVTICNLNPYKKSAVIGTPIAQLMDQYSGAVDNQLQQGTAQFDLKGDAAGVLNRASEVLPYLVSQLPESTKRSLVYTRDELIADCSYGARPCNMDHDFQLHMDPVYGACYIFNYWSPPVYNSTRAGPLLGLRLLVHSNQSEYLDMTSSAGVRVSILGQNQPPFPDSYGYDAANGFTTSIGLQLYKTHRKGPPYGHCRDTPGPDYFYSGSYSTEACFRSCWQRWVLEQCGCGDPRDNLPSNLSSAKYCPLDKMDCVRSVSQSKNGRSICQCPSRCRDSIYVVSVTSGLWPSKAFAPSQCAGEDMEECRQRHSQNTALVQVYYEQMQYQEITESEAYSLVNLISDLGGQLGLWLGSSVITLIEFCSLPLLLVAGLRRRPPVDRATGQVSPFHFNPVYRWENRESY